MRAVAALLAAALFAAVPFGVAAREFRGAPAGDFDLYILALSWSPGFCAAGGADRSPEQCSTGRGLGFVVHGLWPQYNRGYPSFCGPQGREPRRADLDLTRDVFPTIGLARHAWRKHGTCSGLSPEAYFRAAADAFGRLSLPEELGDTGDAASAMDVTRAFVAANPGLRADMMTVDCIRADSGATVLQEVRLCFSRDLRRFQTCPDEVLRDRCRAPTFSIPAPE